MSGAPKEACDLYFHQSSTVMPVSMLEFDVDSENYMLPVPGYLPQQDFNCAGGFSSSSCVPLVPLSSVLIPVSGEVADVDGAGNVVGTTDYNVSSVCEAYTCIPPSNHGISADSIQPTDMQSSVTNNTGPIEAQPSIIYSMDSAPLSTPLVSFVDAPGYNDQYATVSTSASCVVTEAAASTSTALVPVKKCGRPRKTPVSVDPDLIKTAIVANSTAEVPPYDPSHFWCPLCGMAYTVSVCPIHPIAVELDRVVPTYARLTLPAGLELDDKPEAVRVLCTRRWPPCTRFGPVVAPLVTEAQLQLCPDWWPSCSFRLDPPTNSSEPVRYLKLSDESVCNWMMFVRREETLSVTSKRQRRPNCVAYQSGSEGIFFLTTKAIRPGEELLVTLAPPYANRSHSIAHSQSESDAAIKLPTGQPRPKRSIPSDEIHCFRCSITFDSEEAFRVHCLGHPDESAVRGFVDVDETTTASSETTFGRDRPPSRPDTGYIRLRKPVSKDGQNASVSIGKHIVYFRSTLQCSICFTSFQGLPKLVEHTNTAHSISHPRIFKRVPNSLPALTPSYFGDVADEFVTAGDLDSEQLIDKSGSSNMPPLYDFHGSNPLSVLSAENFIVVDLTNASQNLLEQTFWAYGCGQCKQRFPSMLALEQHKDALHNEGNPSSLAVSHQLQLDELLLPTQFTESASAVLVPPENKGDAMHQNVATREDPCACNVQQISSENSNTITVGSATLNATEALHRVLSSAIQPEHGADPGKSHTDSVSIIQCTQCFKDFRSRSALARHVHSGTCDPLIRTIRRVPHPSGRLRARVLRVTRNEFHTCLVCGERFSTRSSWNTHHLKHRRPVDKLYPCTLCTGSQERTYEAFDQLRRHMRQVHTNQIFPCPYCDWTFGRRKNLINHLTRHTGRRDFVCPHDGCLEAYSRKDKLKTHMKTHIDNQKTDFLASRSSAS